jgi:hypothetical protein
MAIPQGKAQGAAYMTHAPGDINTASKLGPHTQTDRGTCPSAGL